MLTFQKYLKALNEGRLMIHKRFSFDDWLVENDGKKIAITLNPMIQAAIRSDMKSQSREQILNKAESIMEIVKQKLFSHFPMWRAFWSKMPPIASFGAGSVDQDGFGTMATSGTEIFYCPFFVVEQYEIAKAIVFKDKEIPKAIIAARQGLRHPMDYCLFVIIHEILHCSLKHHIRTPTFETDHLSPDQLHFLWNIAADYEINHILLDDVKSDLYMMPLIGVRADSGDFQVPVEELKFFTESSAEKIFYRLAKNAEALEKERQEKNDSTEESDDSPISVGDVIFEPETGKYGVVDAIDGENATWTEISKEEAMERVERQ